MPVFFSSNILLAFHHKNTDRKTPGGDFDSALLIGLFIRTTETPTQTVTIQALSPPDAGYSDHLNTALPVSTPVTPLEEAVRATVTAIQAKAHGETSER